jgi:hypothetical protein
MQKIPTLFERDWNGDRSRVTRSVHEGCEWVIAGEGAPTRKLDGTCCLIRDNKLFKRRELRAGEVPPVGFEPAGLDEETKNTVGWVPVGDGPEDRYHREASLPILDGTYELVGPKVQGNPEKWDTHQLVAHDSFGLRLTNVPRDYDGLAAWLAWHDYEGVVWHHPDGRMAKIKGRDFGIKR